jgi:hypothetical protein
MNIPAPQMPPPDPSRAAVWTSPGAAPRSRRTWTVIAIVMAVFGVCCLPIAPMMWWAMNSRWGLAIGLGGAVFWFVLMAVSLLVRRSKQMDGGGEPRPILSAAPEGIVIGGTYRVPYNEIVALGMDWQDAGPRRPAFRPGTRIADDVLDAALDANGGRLTLIVTLDLRAFQAPPDDLPLFKIVRTSDLGGGITRCTISLHPLLVVGDMAGVHRVIAQNAQRVGVPVMAS